MLEGAGLGAADDTTVSDEELASWFAGTPPLAPEFSEIVESPPGPLEPSEILEPPEPLVPTGSLDTWLDEAFSDIVSPASDAGTEAQPELAEEAAPEAPGVDMGLDEVGDMFGSIAASYVRPVRQFAKRLEAGPVSTDWLEMCLPAVGMVSRSAKAMGLTSLGPYLDAFETALHRAGEGDSRTIDGASRTAVLLAYSELAAALPQAFGVEDEGDHRDSIILHSMLRQIPDVGKVTLDKIFGAGLNSVDMLERASVQDIALTTGIPERLAERICRSLEEYRSEWLVRQGAASPEEWLPIVGPVLAELEAHHEAFARFADSDEEIATKRQHRRARQNAALKINVLLAEMGEAHLVDEVQRLTFDGRIERLRGFLATLGGEGAVGGGRKAEAKGP